MPKLRKKDIVLSLYFKINNNFTFYEREFLSKKNLTPIKYINIICKSIHNFLLKKKIKLYTIYFYSFKNNYYKYKKGIYFNLFKNCFHNKKKQSDNILYYDNGEIKFIGTYLINDQNINFYEGNGISFDTCRNIIYEGEFKNGKYYGTGKIYYKNGNIKYNGEFKNNIFDGNGTFYNENGNIIYEGEFKENKYNGFGKYYNKNGILKCEGEFIDNNLNGNGIYYYRNGFIYKGVFINNLFDGLGQLYDNNNKIFISGYWKQNKYIGICNYINFLEINKLDSVINRNEINRIDKIFLQIKNEFHINKSITNIEIDIKNIINAFNDNNIDILENKFIKSQYDIELIVGKVCSLLNGFNILNTSGDGNGNGIFDKQYILSILKIENFDDENIANNSDCPLNTLGKTIFNPKCKCANHISIFDKGNCVKNIIISKKIVDYREFAMILAHEIMHLFIHNYQRYYRKNLTYSDKKVDLILTKRKEEGICELVRFIIGLYFDTSYDVVYSISKYTNEMFYNLLYKNDDILNIEKSNFVNDYYYGFQDAIEILKEKKTLIKTFEHMMNYKNNEVYHKIEDNKFITSNIYNLIYSTDFIKKFSLYFTNLKSYNENYLKIIYLMINKLLFQIKKNKNKFIYNLALNKTINGEYLETVTKNDNFNKLLYLLNYSITNTEIIIKINKNLSYNDTVTFYNFIIKIFDKLYNF